jgi:U3 small nucleolar RNA-associated protein 15
MTTTTTTTFKKLLLPPTPKQEEHEKNNNFIWSRFHDSVVVKEFAAVLQVQFQQGGKQLATCSSTRIQIYSPLTGAVLKTISRFSDTVLSCFSSHKLLVAGDAQGKVQVFDLGSRAILRTLNGHVSFVSFPLTLVLSAVWPF